MQRGADPCAKGSDGETPLEKALKLGNCNATIVLSNHKCA